MADTEKENTIVEPSKPTEEELDNTIKEKEDLIKKQNELLEQQQKNLEIAKRVLEQQQLIQERQIKEDKDPLEWFQKKIEEAKFYSRRDNDISRLGDKAKDPEAMNKLLSLYAAAYKKLHPEVSDEEMFRRMADNVLYPMQTGKFRIDNI